MLGERDLSRLPLIEVVQFKTTLPVPLVYRQ